MLSCSRGELLSEGVRSHRDVDPALCLNITAAPWVQSEGEEGVLDQDGYSSQDEGRKQVHVDVVPHAVKLPNAHVDT